MVYNMVPEERENLIEALGLGGGEGEAGRGWEMVQPV
jgi:hypothetical protein